MSVPELGTVDAMHRYRIDAMIDGEARTTAIESSVSSAIAAVDILGSRDYSMKRAVIRGL